MWGKVRTAEPTIQCSLVKSPVIFIEAIPRQKMAILMEEYSHQEWLAYLVGRKSEKDNIFVEDISIPPHDGVSGASAEGAPLKSYHPDKGYEFYTPKACVGVIHSHHHMGAFHSGTDQAYVDRNFPVSITVAFNGENALVFDAVSYQKTPCGKEVTVKCLVKYVQPPPMFDKDKFLSKAKENIDKGKKTYQYQLAYGAPEFSLEEYRARLGRITGNNHDEHNLCDMVVDNRGHALSKTMIEDILANSEKGKD